MTTDTAFAKYAGQLVKDGVMEYMPLVNFENTMNATAFKAIGNIAGLIPKIGMLAIAETDIFDNPLSAVINKATMEFGAGREKFWFTHGSPNKAWNGKCVPAETVTGVSQVDAINFAMNSDLTVKDNDYKRGTMNASNLGSYVGELTKTLYKTQSAMKFTAWKQLLSNVISGVRSITSYLSSDDPGTGTEITYAPTITGYAGLVRDSQVYVPEVVPGTMITALNVGDTLTITELINDSVSEMKYEQATYSGLGVNNFIRGEPVLVMETKVLNAMDNALNRAPVGSGIPTKTARDIVRRDATLIEIDSFASLPTNANYADKRCIATIIDRRALWDINADPYTVEAQRCVGDRSTRLNLQGKDILTIDRGYPACGILAGTTAPPVTPIDP